MRAARRTARWALLAVVPLLVAAADPAGDVAGCRGGPGEGAPDLIRARGEIVERGTSARWTFTFAEPLVLPDAEGRPFRVDVAIRDPDVPALSFGFYRRVNRLVRMDATIEHPTQILLIPERGTNTFTPPTVDGDTLTIQVPGRTLTDDEELTGTSPGLEQLRWTAIVRDEGACDVLGNGRPRQRLLVVDEVAPRSDVPAGTAPWPAVAVVLVALAIGGLVAYRSRR